MDILGIGKRCEEDVMKTRIGIIAVVMAAIMIVSAVGLCGCANIMGKAVSNGQGRTGIDFSDYGKPVSTSVHTSDVNTVTQFKMKLTNENAARKIKAVLDSKYTQRDLAEGVPVFGDSDIRDDLDSMETERIYEGHDALGDFYIVITHDRNRDPYLFYFG